MTLSSALLTMADTLDLSPSSPISPSNNHDSINHDSPSDNPTPSEHSSTLQDDLSTPKDTTAEAGALTEGDGPFPSFLQPSCWQQSEA